MSLRETLPWILIQNLVNTITYVKRSPWLSSVDQPNEIKTYPGKEYLFASRIFKPANTNGALPLVIRIHGGGFMMNNPAGDDHLARRIADEAKCVVVSMDYSKVPRNPFPAAYEDLIDLSLAAIADESLNVKKSKVFLCGSSAGGNLALSIAQDSRLRSKLAGVLAIAPVAELVTPLAEKVATRPDPSVPDFLEASYGRMLKFYLQDSSLDPGDIRISPNQFSKREDLPKDIYILSVEHDLLSKEAELMAEKLAGRTKKQKFENGWQAGSVRWSLIRGQKHAYEAFPEKDKQLEEARVRAIDRTEQDIVSWLTETFAVE